MGNFFSREQKKAKPISYKRTQTYQNSYSSSSVSFHVPNNFSKKVTDSPPPIRKNIIQTTTDFQRIWVNERLNRLGHTYNNISKAPQSNEVPRKIQRQSTTVFQRGVKNQPIKVPTWQPMPTTKRQDRSMKREPLSKQFEAYSCNQNYNLANLNQKQKSISSNACNNFSYQSSRHSNRSTSNLLAQTKKVSQNINNLKNSAFDYNQKKINVSMDRSRSVIPAQIKSQEATYNNDSKLVQIIHKRISFEQSVQIDFRQQKYLFDTFILRQMLSFKLPKRKRLSNSYSNIKQYSDIMLNLLKQEISSGINQKLQEKKDLTERDCIKIVLQPRESLNKFDSKGDIVMRAKVEEEKEQLQSLLLMGPCLGLITKSFPFKKNKLTSNEHSTHMCIIKYLSMTDQILAHGLEKISQLTTKLRSSQDSINGNKKQEELAYNEFYFLDLTPISSYQKQFIATLKSYQSPLIPAIMSNKSTVQTQAEILQRKRCLDIANSKIYARIVQKRNSSQVAAIKGTFQHSAGIFLIQGPPGTGKTESITNLIALQYDLNLKNRKNMKILVCAQSNAAVDNIARKIRQNGLIGMHGRPYILKLGCVDEVADDGLQINLNHICETRILGTTRMKQKWSATLRVQVEGLKSDLKKARLAQQPFNKIKVIRDKLKKTQRQLTIIRKKLALKRQEYIQIQKEELSKCEIYFSTLNTSGSSSTLTSTIDKISCLIIDEASQATQPSTLIPLLTRTRKIILVGDHKQLQPTVMSSQANHTMYNRSLFERMADLGVQPYLLNIQYRMHPELSLFSSNYFYEGKVKDGNCKDKTPLSLQKIKSRALFIDLKTIKEEQYKNSKINRLQAECIMTLIKLLVNLDCNLQIGVIAPYKAQINLLEQKVEEAFKNRKAYVRVSTVDAFQGQQVDVVVFSCVRANKQKKIGFVSDPKRLNVAITRAKHALFVFGNSYTFDKDLTWRAYLDHHQNSATMIAVHEIVRCKGLLVDHINGQKF